MAIKNNQLQIAKEFPPYIVETEKGWYILIKAQPGAKKSELCGESDGLLRIRLAAPAVENKANEALLEFMADLLKLRKNKLQLAGGEKSRSKKIFISAELSPDFSVLEHIITSSGG